MFTNDEMDLYSKISKLLVDGSIDEAYGLTLSAIRKYPENYDLYELRDACLLGRLSRFEKNNDFINLVKNTEELIKNIDQTYLILEKALINSSNEEKDHISKRMLNSISTKTQLKILTETGKVNQEMIKLSIENKEIKKIIIKINEELKASGIKQFEQLSLLAAFLAIIITNVQNFSKLSIEKIIILNTSLTISLLVVLTLGNFLLDIGRYPEITKQWKPIVIIGVVSLFLFIQKFLLNL